MGNPLQTGQLPSGASRRLPTAAAAALRPATLQMSKNKRIWVRFTKNKSPICKTWSIFPSRPLLGESVITKAWANPRANYTHEVCQQVVDTSCGESVLIVSEPTVNVGPGWFRHLSVSWRGGGRLPDRARPLVMRGHPEEQQALSQSREEEACVSEEDRSFTERKVNRVEDTFSKAEQTKEP